MPFEFLPDSEIPDVVLIKPRVFKDERGWFAESYKRSDFEAHGIAGDFRQDNHSLSVGRGMLRGLHLQREPMAQGKLVRCLQGEIFDVAVDTRPGSETFGQWVGERLSSENHHVLWVPAGFAHGFQTLTERTEVAYKTTAEYSPQHEASIRWNDPRIGIDWPIPDAILNERDAAAPLLEAVA